MTRKASAKMTPVASSRLRAVSSARCRAPSICTAAALPPGAPPEVGRSSVLIATRSLIGGAIPVGGDADAGLCRAGRRVGGLVLERLLEGGERSQLRRLDRHQAEMPRRQPAQPLRLGEQAELRLQDVDLLLLADDLAAQAAHFLLQALHLVGHGQQHHRKGDRQQQAERRRLPDEGGPAGHAALLDVSEDDGPADGPQAGAPVRSAARSRAERARGFRAVSCADGRIARVVISRKLGSRTLAGAASGLWRDGLGLRPLRRRRNAFTRRSSSEWKATTTSRPPGASSVRPPADRGRARPARR